MTHATVDYITYITPLIITNYIWACYVHQIAKTCIVSTNIKVKHQC